MKPEFDIFDKKELRQLRRDYLCLHDAHLKIMDTYVKAPGWPLLFLQQNWYGKCMILLRKQ